MAPTDHQLGYSPAAEARAKAAWLAAGGPPRFRAQDAPDVDRPRAFSLSNLVCFWWNQGPVGSCFSNGPLQAVALMMAFLVARLGQPGSIVQLSRHWVWYFGRKLDGLLGTRDDGGSVTNAVRAVHDYGIVPDSLLPYKPSHSYLEQAPSAQVVAAAKPFGITAMVEHDLDDPDAIEQSLVEGKAIAIGMAWPRGWDQGSIDQYGRTTKVGFIDPRDGHALAIIGYVRPNVWDQYRWYHIINSHGPIYPLPSPEMRAAVEGYASAHDDACYAFWAREDHLKYIAANYAGFECVAPDGAFMPDSGAVALDWSSAAA